MSHVDYNGNPESGATEGRPSARSPLLRRIAYTVGFAILGWALLWFIFAVTVLQLVVTAVAGERNRQLAEFGSRLASWMGEIVRYLTGGNDTVPFPFAPFPET